MHVVVVTCAHRGDDARIVHRQARALLEAGHRVTLVAPEPDSRASDPVGLLRVPIRRAAGRHRVAAWRDVRRAVSPLVDGADVILVHDPEVALLAPRRWSRAVLVWDVHEDYVASVADRSWIPGPVRPGVRRALGVLQRRSGRRMRHLLAEHSYAAFLPGAPVIPNSTWVPTDLPDEDRADPPEVVYVGRLSFSRGVTEMVALGRAAAGAFRVVLIGPADGDVATMLRGASDEGAVDWRGPLPNPEALAIARRATVGLALLHDEPNYRHSMPTKLIEYLANGVPVVSTPLPLARALVEDSGGGVVVPFGDADALFSAVRRIAEDTDLYRSLRRAGHEHVAEHHNWAVDGPRFVTVLERWAASSATDEEPGSPTEVHRREDGEQPQA